jgi:hypothetical protein
VGEVAVKGESEAATGRAAAWSAWREAPRRIAEMRILTGPWKLDRETGDTIED